MNDSIMYIDVVSQTVLDFPCPSILASSQLIRLAHERLDFNFKLLLFTIRYSVSSSGHCLFGLTRIRTSGFSDLSREKKYQKCRWCHRLAAILHSFKCTGLFSQQHEVLKLIGRDQEDFGHSFFAFVA